MTQQEREKIVHIISSEIQKQGSVKLAALMYTLKKHGLKKEDLFGKQGLKRWMKAEFPEFTIEGTNGKEILLFSDHDKNGQGEEKQPESKETDFSELDSLFEHKKYAEFLSSDLMRETRPDMLPVSYMEKALCCAEHLLYPERDCQLTLNLFQRELIESKTPRDFIVKWKRTDGYDPLMIEGCAQTALASLHPALDRGIAAVLLNQLGQSTRKNEDYSGMTARFGMCENTLAPYFFVIRMFTHPVEKEVQKCIDEYTKLVKGLKTSLAESRIDQSLILYGFTEFLEVLDQYIFPLGGLNQFARRKIISVFIEHNRMDELKKIMKKLDPACETVDGKMLTLYEHPETWTEEKFQEFLKESPNKMLMEKTIELLWEKERDKEFPKKVFRILSWVLVYDSYLSVDEILCYHSKEKFGRGKKYEKLLNCCENVMKMAQEEPSMYALASYVMNMPWTERDANADGLWKYGQWEKLSDDFFQHSTAPYEHLTAETAADFVKLFRIYRLDPFHERQLQDRYADWQEERFSKEKMDAGETAAHLKRLWEEMAYEAYTRIFRKTDYDQLEPGVRRELVKEYIDSLVQMQQYAEALFYLQRSHQIEKNEKLNLFIRVLNENFRVNGLEEKAYSIFSDSFTEQDAIELILDSLKTVGHFGVVSLIALYCHRRDYTRAIYLYVLCREKIETGMARFYLQFRKLFERYIGKVNTYYDVIELSFKTLCQDSLIDFLRWTGQVPVPKKPGERQIHAFSRFYDAIMERPLNSDVWLKFLGQLMKFPVDNSWLICVCDMILRRKVGYIGPEQFGTAVRNVMRNSGFSELPMNFLPYCYLYIMEGTDAAFVNELMEYLKIPDVRKRVLENNLWYETYESTAGKFKEYCLNTGSRTGEEVYYSLLELLKMDLNISDLGRMSQISADKKYLFRQLFQNYLAGSSMTETVKLINEMEQKSLPYCDREVLSVLKMIFEDDEKLIAEKGELFPDEETVSRLKWDCSRILAAYPEKQALLEFDRTCGNKAYKWTVYSFVMGAVYDRDLYDKYNVTYAEFADRLEYRAFLAFSGKSFQAQLDWNSTYDFSYKRMRYLKMLLAAVLQKEDDPDDDDILETIKRHGHFELLYQDTYQPFKERILTFRKFENMSGKAKECFLYSLMQGSFYDFLNSYAEELADLEEKQKETVREIVGLMEYRDISRAVYLFYQEEINVGRFEHVLRLTEALSVYAYDTLCALGNAGNVQEELQLFWKIAILKKPSECVRTVREMNMENFLKHAELLVPLACSRQFVFRIYGSFRGCIIQKNWGHYAEKFGKFEAYLKRKGVREAEEVGRYLNALEACMQQNREAAQKAVDGEDLTEGIPQEWRREAKRILEFVAGESSRFNPDRLMVDNSLEAPQKKFRAGFAARLQKLFGIERKELDIEKAEELYERFRYGRGMTWERLKDGLTVLCNYPKMGKYSDRRIPSRRMLTLEIGLDAVSPEINLSLDDKAEIIMGLFSERAVFHREAPDKEAKIRERFGQILQRGLSLSAWVHHADLIETYLGESGEDSDFGELRRRILEPCRTYLGAEYSYEKRYRSLKELTRCFGGLESVYAGNVLEAVRAEMKALEDGIRLTVRIINQKNRVSDGYVYFEILNTGKRTVSLTEDAVIGIKQDNQPEIPGTVKSISNLRGGFRTGGRARLILADRQETVDVSIQISTPAQGEAKEIICTDHRELVAARSTRGFRVDPDTKYDVRSAVSDSQMLFGRENLKEDLKRSIPGGVTVIYGPSRIGKTSLMNWIRNDYAVSRGNVMTILFGGEGGLGKERDYQVNFVDSRLPVPYENDEEMTEYLLAQTIIQSFRKMHRRIKKPSVSRGSQELEKRLIRALSDETSDLGDRYWEMNEILSEAKIELWLMLDEFQQVVERWKPEITSRFVEICSMLSGHDGLTQIKLIVCGSDDLLRHMVLEDHSVWRSAFPVRIAVEPLEEKPFGEMIQKDAGIAKANVFYSDSAKAALYNYTGGAALYGKEICNAVLEDIRSHPERYRNRNVLYVSDIAAAAQRLLNRQTSELDTKAREGVREIYDAVTKNLDYETDMQYLWYMAKWLSENPAQNGFPEEIFFQRPLRHGTGSLKDSLAIASARGIIRGVSEEDGMVYVFQTLFYYFAFLGSAKDNLQEELIFQEESYETEEEQEDSPDQFYTIEKIGAYFDSRTESEQARILGALAGSAKKEAAEKIRQFAAKHIEGDEIAGNKQVSNITIHVESITTILNEMMEPGDPEKRLESIRRLPRLDSYLPSGGLRDGEKEIPEERLSRAMGNYVADLEEGLDTALSEHKARQARYWEILKVKPEAFDHFMEQYALPQCFLDSLQFAYQLEQLFEEGAVGDGMETIDFSPVTIMYCKLVESLLKEYHMRPYSDAISSVETDMYNRKKHRKYIWGEIKQLPQYQKQRLTIGSFAHPVSGGREAAEHLTALAQSTPGNLEQWKQHAACIKAVRDIRNPSAHGNKDARITCEQMQKIRALLLDEGGLLRLIQIVKEPI